MKAKLLLLLLVPLLALLIMIRLPAEDVVTPQGSEPPKASGKVTLMSAEQGEALQGKIDQYLDQQKKILEKIEQMEKDMEFVKSASRTRGRVVPTP
jgi:hypothetical protein